MQQTIKDVINDYQKFINSPHNGDEFEEYTKTLKYSFQKAIAYEPNLADTESRLYMLKLIEILTLGDFIQHWLFVTEAEGE